MPSATVTAGHGLAAAGVFLTALASLQPHATALALLSPADQHTEAVLGRLPPDVALELRRFCYPTQPADVLVAIAGFFGVLAVFCTAAELLNTGRWALGAEAAAARRRQQGREILDNVSPVICSTTFTLLWFAVVYPARWGHRPPITPMGGPAAVAVRVSPRPSVPAPPRSHRQHAEPPPACRRRMWGSGC